MPIVWPARYALAEAHLAGPAQYFDAAHLGSDLLGAVGGAVGAPVVDDEDVRVGDGGPDAMHQGLEVVGLVERRDRDPDVAGRVLLVHGVIRTSRWGNAAAGRPRTTLVYRHALHCS